MTATMKVPTKNANPPVVFVRPRAIPNDQLLHQLGADASAGVNDHDWITVDRLDEPVSPISSTTRSEPRSTRTRNRENIAMANPPSTTPAPSSRGWPSSPS